MLVAHNWGGVIERAPYRFFGSDPKVYWCIRCEDYVSEYSACPSVPSEQGGNDLGAPQSAPVDRSATEGAEGSQIFDVIEKPAHYNHGAIEVADAIEDWKLPYFLGNVVKYVARCDYKGKPVEDLKKAVWYLNREIARREAEATD